MSRDAQAVLDAFDHLPPVEREEVAHALLRRLAQSEHQSFSDEELVAAGDSVFSMYDDEESAQQ